MADQGFSGYSILIVDDDAAISSIYETYFKSMGFTTYTATDGAAGLEVARQNHPSLILLDIMMPKMDGREMLKQLKADQNLQNTPVIIFSALITELEREEMLAAGAVDYVEKSDIESPDQLLPTVKKALGIA